EPGSAQQPDRGRRPARGRLGQSGSRPPAVLRLTMMLVATLLAAAVVALARGASGITWYGYTPPFNATSLAGVAATSASDAWAVGLRSGGSCQYATLAEHWDGSAWSEVATPSVQRL